MHGKGLVSSWCLCVLLGACTIAAQAAPVGASAGAQPAPQFRRYGVDDGLASGVIYSVAQDHRGMMWFGAASGLVRFDGTAFKVFRHLASDPASLPANQTYAVFVDRRDRIWAGGVTSGLILYDQSTQHFQQWEHDKQNAASLSNDEVWALAQTADGQMWVATQSGLDRWLPDGSGFAHVAFGTRKTPGKLIGPTRALLAEADGRLWIGTESGLYLRHADGVITAVSVDPLFAGNIGTVWHIEGGGDDVRVSVNGGLLIIAADGVARPLDAGKLASLRVSSSVRDPQDRLWMGTATGLMMRDEHGQLRHIGGQSLLPGGLPSDRVWQVLRDREGGTWVTFEQAGIAYLAPHWNGVTRFTHIPDDPASLSDAAVLSVQTSRDGKLWVGGFSGWVDKLDPDSGQVQHVVRDLNNSITSVYEDASGRLWMTGPSGFFVYDHGKVTTLDPLKTHASRPIALVPGAGQLFLSSWGDGVLAVDTTNMAARPLVKQEDLGETAFHSRLAFHSGRLWYASVGGLQRTDENGVLGFVSGVPEQNVLGFDFDPDGGFWTFTETALEHYRQSSGSATRIDRVDMSAKDFTADLRAMRVDRRGDVWLFGDPGLWRFDPKTRQFTKFGRAQGLSNAEFSNGSTAVLPDGRMFVASNGGVMAFQPSQLVHAGEPDAPPLLSLVKVTVRRGGHLQALATHRAQIDLQWDDRDLSVVARLSSFIDPATNRYRFRLHGLDSTWVDATNRGERDFTGLRAGVYTLEVNAASADGKWHALAQPLRVTVQAPPWARWWAWLVYVLVAALLIGAFLLAWRRRLATRHHLQLLEQQRQMADSANAAKTHFLTTLSHEIRTPMTGVMGMAELLLGTPLTSTQRDYTRTMQRSGSMLLKLLNDALDLSRIEAGRLELEPAPFSPRQLLDEVIDLECGLARLKGIDLRLDVPEPLPPHVLGDALRIKQVLLNLVSNALKFTQQGSVTVAATRSAEGLLFSVSDTGPGISEAGRARLFERFEQLAGPQRGSGSGLGLAICRELVSMMGGSIELESGVGGGSMFRVCLPLGEPPADAVPAPPTSAAHGTWRILLVEDDLIVAAVIGGLLQMQGHTVCHVINGLAALAELSHASFDALLLDLDLPFVDGFQVARLIRGRETGEQRLPIVAVTARSGSDDEARARAAGMDGFLRKPLTGEQLADALANALQSNSAMPA